MLKKAVPNLKRWVSGYLVAVITLMLVFNNSFALSALAAETASESNAESRASTSGAIKNSRVTLKNRSVSDKDVDDVQMFVLSDHRDYQPGDTVCLELYIKNNTDEVISDGLLRFKAKGIEEDSAYFEDLNDLYMKVIEAEEKAAEAEAAIKESEKQAEESQEQKEEREAQAAENQEQEGSGEQAEEDEKEEGEASSENQAEQAEPSGEAETAEERSEAGNSGSKEAEETLQTAEPETTAREEINVIGEVSGELDESDTTDNDDTDSEKDEEEEDPTRLTEIEIEPGKAYYVNFYYTIDPEIEKIKDQNVEFTFSWADDDAIIKRPSVKEIFRYTVDGLNLLPVVTGGEKGWVQIGEEDEMLLEFDLGRIEEVLEEAEMEELEKNPEATVSAARRASMSNALIGWDAEEDGKLKGKNDPAVVRNLKLEVETFDVKLNEFKVVPVDEHIDDNFGTTVACKFIVSRKNEPGTHFGRVTASYKIKGKTYRTTQAFCVKVKPEEGEMELSGKAGDAEIVMTGSVESFPKADDLSLKVTEVSAEQQEMVEEALQKKAEEEGTEINQYKALDIKLIADGEETEPLGDVQVRFKNVNMEKVGEKKAVAEEPTAEEKSVAKRMMRKVRSFFVADKAEEETEEAAVVAEEGTIAEENTEKTGEKAEGTEEDKEEESSGSIKVLHLDEDEIVANEMTSEVLENGDIVMDTDHFSIYIVVNIQDMKEDFVDVPITIEHWATFDKWNLEIVKTEVTARSGGKPSKFAENVYPVTGTVVENGKLIYEYEYIENGEKKTGRIGRTQLEKTITNNSNVGEAQWLVRLTEKDQNEGKVGRLYPGASKVNGQYVYEPAEPVQLYSTDNLTLTGIKEIKYELLLSKYSKVSSADHYKVKAVQVWDKVKNTWGPEIKEGSDKKEIKLDKDENKIRIIYEPTEAPRIMGDVGFHDYNVSIETIDDVDKQSSDASKDSLRTNRVGINNAYLWTDTNGIPKMQTTEKTENRIGVGIVRNYATDTSRIMHRYLDQMASAWLKEPLKKDIPDLSLSEEKNQISFGSMVDPGLFYPGNVNSKEIYNYKKGTSQPQADYLAKEYFNNYQLEFLRRGDTYTLSRVCEDGEEVIANLDKLPHTKKDGADSGIYSNLFWPLDEVVKLKEKDGKRRDPLFGNNNYNSQGWTNDEGNGVLHNWYFGMRYDFEFTMGDYIGPLNYYFRGDDDFWLFIDGELVQDVDLGGIHTSRGAYVDMRQWMIEREKLTKSTEPGEERFNEPDKKHYMSVFFMERGGSGSTCYMSFTLPNATPLPTPDIPQSDKTSVMVTKEWKDELDRADHPPIEVQLKRDGVPYASVFLNESNNWTWVWDNLPKNHTEIVIDENNKEKKIKVDYTYTVEEPTGLPRYEAHYMDPETEQVKNCTIFKIVNVRKTEVKVEKKWDDSENLYGTRPDEIKVQLYKKHEDIPSSEVNQPGENNPSQTEGTGSETENAATGSGTEGDATVGEGIPSPDSTADATDSSSTEGNNSENDTSKKNEYEIPDDGEDSDWEPIGTPVILKENAETKKWEYSWGDLPLYDYVDKDPDPEEGTTPDPDAPKEKVFKKVIYAVKEVTETSAEDNWYSVSYEGDSMLGFTITNTLQMAKLRVKKWVNNEAGEPNEPIARPYRFIIKILEVIEGEGTEPEYKEYTTVALMHDITSDYILVPIKGNSRKFIVKEIVPMEYDMTGMNLLNPDGTFATDNKIEIESVDEKKDGEEGDTETGRNENPQESDGSSGNPETENPNGNSGSAETKKTKLLAELKVDEDNNEIYWITLYPGGDAIVQVNNKPSHTPYFHHTYSVTNKNEMGSNEGFGLKDTTAENPEGSYNEQHGKGNASSVPLAAATEYDCAVAYMGESVNGKEKRMDWGDDLNA